jgi:hypothetical protein
LELLTDQENAINGRKGLILQAYQSPPWCSDVNVNYVFPDNPSLTVGRYFGKNKPKKYICSNFDAHKYTDFKEKRLISAILRKKIINCQIGFPDKK